MVFSASVRKEGVARLKLQTAARGGRSATASEGQGNERRRVPTTKARSDVKRCGVVHP